MVPLRSHVSTGSYSSDTLSNVKQTGALSLFSYVVKDAMEVGNYQKSIQLCNKALTRQPDLHIVKVGLPSFYPDSILQFDEERRCPHRSDHRQ
jgi:hypothetical protein